MYAIFLDIETTGLDPRTNHAIDIAFQVIDHNSGKRVATYKSIIKQPKEAWNQRDPKSIEINGYTWEEVQTGKDPDVVKEEIVEIFEQFDLVRGKAVFICQNPAFDRMFLSQLIPLTIQEKLKWPYHWLDLASMYWALLLEKSHNKGTGFPTQVTLSKNEIAKIYGIPPEEHPHRAINGVNHLIACYQKVLGVHFDTNETLALKRHS